MSGDKKSLTPPPISPKVPLIPPHIPPSSSASSSWTEPPTLFPNAPVTAPLDLYLESQGLYPPASLAALTSCQLALGATLDGFEGTPC